MKLKDILFFAGFVAFFLPFFLSSVLMDWFEQSTINYPLSMSFLKFAVLASLGESIGLRIRAGVYNQKGFGLLPRAIVWGLLGYTIYLAFVVFSAGVPVFLQKIGLSNALELMAGPLSWGKVLVAFGISFTMNVIYAPVMMTFHRITDMHIVSNGGSLRGLFLPIKMGQHFQSINWSVQWNFVFKKTIPFFWIPAHTITFLLPPEYRVLMAAILGIVLGVLLAIAARMETPVKKV
jgi:hypothetical protein